MGVSPRVEQMLPVNTLRRLLTWDQAVFLWICRLHRPWCTKLMKGLTHFGDATSWTIVALILLSVGSPEAERVGMLVGLGALFAAVFAQVVKRISRRPRPDSGIAGFKALVGNPDAYSFPSGHTAAAFGVAVAVMGSGAGLAPLMGVLAFGIGFSRVYLGAHYPLDVAVGAGLGTVAGVCAQYAL